MKQKLAGLRDAQRHPCTQVFLFALLISALVFLPFVIMDRGLFFYYGDFNVQQIPFYQLVHRAVRNGEVFWDWYTDLGVNFIGSYSFYNLFSPFFWLTLPFPNAALPYLMAPLLVLKTACAAASGTLLATRFVSDKRYAIFGGLLYAFSGFTTYNIFFNHFHEVIIFFPLMLYALELLVVDKRRGVFALAVTVNAVVNYWFFIGSVVFILLYYFVRTISGGWRMSPGAFFSIAVESVIGVLIACFALLPSALAVMGNPRTTADNLITGWDFWLYSHEQRLPAILASIFFPPDIPSRPNLFPDHGAKWSSLSAWLPMVGPSFVLAYLLHNKGSWLKRMLYLCLFIALVPGLNSVFILFNNSYYTRWFYMPLLLMALASAIILERCRRENDAPVLLRGVKWTAIICLLFTAAIGLTPFEAEEGRSIGFEKYPERLWIYAAIVFLGLIAVWVLIRYMFQNRRFLRMLSIALGFICVFYSISMIAMGRMHSDDRAWMKKIAIKGADELELPEYGGQYYRVDLYDSMDNLGMYWRLPNIQAFHSIIPVSLMEFYPSVGVKRDVSSKPQPEYYSLRSLLSVRFLFVKTSVGHDKQPSTPNFSYYDTQLGYNIYENDNYLNIGLGYDYYLTMEQYNAARQDDRALLMHKAVVVADEDLGNVSQILDPLPEERLTELSDEQYVQDVDERRDSCISNRFYREKDGFRVKLELDREQILFWSVPFDEGWSATINGEETKVLDVNNGFVGLPIPAGESTVRFTYRAPGLKAGILLTAGGLLLLAGYLLLLRSRRRAGRIAPAESDAYAQVMREAGALPPYDPAIPSPFELPAHPPQEEDVPPDAPPETLEEPFEDVPDADPGKLPPQE